MGTPHLNLSSPDIFDCSLYMSLNGITYYLIFDSFNTSFILSSQYWVSMN